MEIGNGNRKDNAQREAKKVPTLRDLSAAVCGERIPLDRPTDFARAQEFVYSIRIPSVQRTICRSLAPPANPKIFVQIGVPYDKVAAKYGIPPNGAEMYDLTEFAVEVMAGERVRKGESPFTIAAELGIPADSLAMDFLMDLVVEGPAGERVRNGEPCNKAAEEHYIPADSLAMDDLMEFAVEGRAGERVRKGESPFTVADEHGIRRNSEAMVRLKMISVEMRFQNGESWFEAAKDLDISESSNAWWQLWRRFTA
ncbi:hypothetical protein [Burkholderia contaminans]|uniref:hypothetical protein n=1 Tax=Burkholderia contaminans TaxID=488447 RepID=UPI001453BDF7|nr:hypothetical protein [Burkholderia contaminans]VWD15531.1 hypothetical protein BCO18442_03510 [Burkholderia contaminans]